MSSIETLKLKNIFKQFLFTIIVILFLSLLFRVLVYAVPIAFIIFIFYMGWKKLKGMLHGHKGTFMNEVKHKDISQSNEAREVFNELNPSSTRIVDVEYEEVDSQIKL